MKEFDFNPFGLESLTVKFNCPNCNHRIESETITVPEPNLMAEKVRDSQVENDSFACCDNCDSEFDVFITVDLAGGSGIIPELDQEAEIDIETEDFISEEEFDWLFGNETFYARFKDEISAITQLNEVEYEDAAIIRSTKRQLYIALITALEAYLADAFIYHLFHNVGYVEKFVEGYEGFEKQKFKLSKLFDYHEKIETICKKELRDIIWHNIPKVSTLYKFTFDIEFGDLSSLSKHVKNRHDLVHRAGATKEGEQITIGADDITSLSEEVEELVDKIDEELNSLRPNEL
jgi:hypothetical protein